MATHSRVIAPHLKDSLSMADAGKYGRMFPGLPSPETDENILLYLGEGRAPLWMPQPLWFYILKEAEVRHHGERLGDVGGDPNSYLNAGTDWKPELPGAQEEHFTMADLLRFARVA